MVSRKLTQLYDKSEAALLKDLRAGVPMAVEYWFKIYHPKLLSFVVAKVSQDSDADELVQETFLNALKQLPLFRSESQLMTWMQAIARHEIADYFRKKYAKKAIQALSLNDAFVQALLPTKVSDSHETSERVKLAIQTLSLQHRELLLLKYIDGKKIEEMAAELHKSVKSIESELFRARQAFKVAYAAVA